MVISVCTTGVAINMRLVVQAFSMASSAELYAHWAPPEERARLIVFSHAGVYFGTAINYPISGYIAKIFGWEAIFYVSGTCS